MEILSFILSVVLGIYFLGAIARWLLRRWILRKQREFEENIGRGGAYRTNQWGNRANNNKDNTREGEVKVEKKAPQDKRVSKDVGEYVEYEESESIEVEYTAHEEETKK